MHAELLIKFLNYILVLPIAVAVAIVMIFFYCYTFVSVRVSESLQNLILRDNTCAHDNSDFSHFKQKTVKEGF